MLEFIKWNTLSWVLNALRRLFLVVWLGAATRLLLVLGVTLFGLSDDFIQLLIWQRLALPFKHFSEIIFSYLPFVISVEVVKSKLQISIRQGYLFVDGSGQELRVIDCSHLIEIEFIKDLVDIVIVQLCDMVVVGKPFLYLF